MEFKVNYSFKINNEVNPERFNELVIADTQDEAIEILKQSWFDATDHEEWEIEMGDDEYIATNKETGSTQVCYNFTVE